MKLQDDKSLNIVLENSQLFSCNRSNFISMFSKIPDGLCVSSKVKREGFEKYMSRVINSKVSKDYQVMMGWLKLADSLERVKSLLLNKDCVASKQYSAACKIFVCPRSFLLASWLEAKDFVVIGREQT